MKREPVPEYVRTLEQRLALVEALVEAPREMRDVVGAAQESRSTVRRAIRDLEEAGFVERVDGGYRATLRGRLAAETCREYVDRIRSIRAMDEALAPLPPTAPIDPALIADGEAHVATGAAPYASLEPVKDVFAEMTRYRAMNATLPDPWFIEHLHARTVKGELSGEMLVTPAVQDVLENRFAAEVAELAATGRFEVLRSDVFRFGLLLAEADETHVFLVVGNRDGSTHATVHATSPAAWQWADDLYTEYRDRATDVTRSLASAASGESDADE